jgi:hypothetical protein
VFIAELADREGLHDAWSLTTRDDLRFEDGVANLVYVDGGVDDPTWFEIVHPRTLEPQRGKATRAIYRRAHLRVRGSTTMSFSLRASLALNTVFSHPRLDISLDGRILTSAVADTRGHFAVDVAVPAEQLAGGWHDLYLISSSIIEPDKDPRDLRVTRLESVEWRPLP